MQPSILPFAAEADWRAAIEATLLLAEREIRIFDDTLERTGLESAKRVETLKDFLAGDHDRRLLIVLQDIGHLQRYCPRLLGLLRLFGHAIEMRRCPDHLQQLTDRYVLADAEHGAIRFHTDHPRGKRVIADPVELRPWWDRFDDLWLESFPVSPASTVGL